MNEDKICICLATDGNYLPYCRNTIRSILRQAAKEENYEFIILGSGLSKAQTDWFCKEFQRQSNVEIRFIDTAPFTGDLPNKVRAYYTAVTYYRALLFSDLFRSYERILYLDSDIVVNRNLSGLFYMDLNGFSAAVVKDYTMDAKMLFGITIDYNNKTYTAESYISEVLELKNFDSYFNAGVILFNLKECRRLWSYQDVLNIFCRETFFLQDQDALNILMEDHVRYLEPMWNFQNVYSLLEKMDTEAGKKLWEKVKCGEPVIIHYVSSIKPWNNEECPMIEYYFPERI